MKEHSHKTLLLLGALSGLALLLAYIALGSNTSIENKPIEKEVLGATTTQQQVTNEPQTTTSSNLNKDFKNMNTVILHTNLGDIELQLAQDRPLTTENFKKLVDSGFYNGIKFHRIIAGFMNQAGDPQSKDDSKRAIWGTGGPGYTFKDELTGAEKYTTGTLAMANAGPNTNGSQFFIMAKDVPLQPNYTVFGHVTKGLDVVQKINSVQTDGSDKPLDPVTIIKAELK